MVSSIGGSSGSLQQLMMPRPSAQDFFKKVDGDGNGSISQSELKTLAADIKGKTGDTLKVDTASITNSDSDGDGSLNATELAALMAASGFGPPQGGQDMDGAPPPPPPDQAISAYSANSGKDTLATLIAGLEKILAALQETTGSSASASSASGRPKAQDFFTKVDSDGSGGISQDELTTLASNLEKMTGQSLTLDATTFAGFDRDGDGSLNSTELKSFMDKSGFAPPPPPPGDLAMRGTSSATSSDDSESDDSSAVSSTSTQDTLAMLKKLLEQLSAYSGNDNNGFSALLQTYS